MATRQIGFLLFLDCSLLDFTGPLTAFDVANRLAGHQHYQLRVMSEQGGLLESASGIAVITRPLERAPLDTLIVAGGAGPREGLLSATLLDYTQHAAAQARRVASVCTGAFVLAAAGLLDGKRATTHWRMATRLQRMHPAVQVDSDKIFIKDGKVWTSAGISAGIDLALALIEEDHGAELARAVARELVVYHRRPGGQSQFSSLLAMDPPSGRIRQALSYARDHLHESLSAERLAEVACLSRRQFDRAFSAETGQTPAKAIEKLRAEVARPRVEAGDESLENIARAVGFDDPERMRRAFLRVFGYAPQAIRRATRQQESLYLS
ncbi:transcriptional regulator GlxA family with amidase domain [Herbaspirillum sp. Sphag1AN]|uniref:GlxA family transcriptional regulator n=1 Tax=unclassified Herbaspirillum TaxID=2624150 RepID=UPI00161C1D93|nr:MULTISPECIES: GlxA family transcriptional regulator [unclassified Herbaspirillum]MBB3211404.1 transcriptional regulator GlxA family with amidase domain [Herbaspirillum sp. Sphag1AN]MBB3245329.1 transcriptional regulator GlxA family with amidase domain [Herbaspirillum sp. Sphag64]